MALQFMDGFDHYATADVTKKYVSCYGNPQILPSSGRRSGGCLSIASNGNCFNVGLPSWQATIIVGAALKFGAEFPGETVIGFVDDGLYAAISVIYTSDGALEVWRFNAATNWQGSSFSDPTVSNATKLGNTASGVISSTTWNYVEVKCTLSDAAGAVVIHVNGATVLNLTSVDTKPNANTTIRALSLQGGAGGTGASWCYWDDLYILDTTGSAPCNDFLGDVRIDALYPNGDGATHDWTCSTGSTHYTLLDESTPNTTDYVSSSTAAQQDLYDFGALPVITSATVFAVASNLCVMKDDAGARSVKHLCRSGGTTYQGDALALPTSYIYKQKVYEQDPKTAAAWTEANVNSAQFGIEAA